MKKYTYLIAAIIIIIFILIGVIPLLSGLFSYPSAQKKPIPLPTAIPVQKTISITTFPTLPTHPSTVAYTATNNDTTFNTRIDTHPALSLSDAQAKQNLIASFAPDQDPVYMTDEFKISYIRTYDMFQVEIETTDIKKAETDVVAWFAARGISKDGVCKIPVQFYPTFSIDQQLRQQGIETPPLADGC